MSTLPAGLDVLHKLYQTIMASFIGGNTAEVQTVSNLQLPMHPKPSAVVRVKAGGGFQRYRDGRTRGKRQQKRPQRGEKEDEDLAEATSVLPPASFRQFCLQTSLHGWQYMVERPVSTCR